MWEPCLDPSENQTWSQRVLNPCLPFSPLHPHASFHPHALCTLCSWAGSWADPPGPTLSHWNCFMSTQSGVYVPPFFLHLWSSCSWLTNGVGCFLVYFCKERSWSSMLLFVLISWSQKMRFSYSFVERFSLNVKNQDLIVERKSLSLRLCVSHVTSHVTPRSLWLKWKGYEHLKQVFHIHLSHLLLKREGWGILGGRYYWPSLQVNWQVCRWEACLRCTSSGLETGVRFPGLNRYSAS